ncbi:hypothetical protein [Kitasatospora sp. NPDC056273]|uniref:hypothetical protein n=1 Tax=Kitasatospora sp. NPDC056273 TaxID=3345769 RepID=UPI0035DF9E51
MTTFLTAIGTKLAERWVNFLLLPGLLWTGLLAAALHLGQHRPFAVGRLSDWLNQLAASPAAHAAGTVILATAATLLTATGVGLLCGAIGGAIERLWAASVDLPSAAWFLRRRQRRWDTATRELKSAILQAAAPQRHHVAPAKAASRVRSWQRRRARLGPARPSCPTWIGDRFERTAVRLAEVNGIDDAAAAWPRLWAVLPDGLRNDIAAARNAYAAVSRLAAWGLLYTALGAAWWPALLIGLALLATAAQRAPGTADVLAFMIETAADLHLNDLASQLAVPATATAAGTGQAISAHLRLAGAPVPRQLP